MTYVLWEKYTLLLKSVGHVKLKYTHHLSVEENDCTPRFLGRLTVIVFVSRLRAVPINAGSPLITWPHPP